MQEKKMVNCRIMAVTPEVMKMSRDMPELLNFSVVMKKGKLVGENQTLFTGTFEASKAALPRLTESNPGKVLMIIEESAIEF